MNVFKKIYCRIFQTCFKIALPILPYRKPDIFYTTSDLIPVFTERKISSVLVVTDQSIRSLGLLSGMLKTFDDSGIKYAVYDKTVPNPTTTNVEEARTIYLENSCSAVIGFGGGSSMDCAKAVAARIAKPKQSLAKMKGIMKIHKKLPLLIAVPTTAGTGSETTLAAVITDADTRHKYAINDFPLIPKYAVLDADVTLSLPVSVTASTGMDALTHAVEAFIGNTTTKETRADSLRAVKLIYENIFTVCTDGHNRDARKNMLEASFYAGAAFTKSYVGYVHAVAHSLGGEYNIPHGLANATLLPFVLEAYGKKIWKKLHVLGIAAGVCTSDESDEIGAKKFIESIKDMKKKIGIGDKLKGIRKEDIPKLSRYADKEGNPLYPVPVLMNAKELEKFYNILME
ncbi:MAG: iron-containing alcohol dehydrogenase [Treponema sp.]|nr:iron-containing alcohol dehydrogenase [Treponema sp.]